MNHYNYVLERQPVGSGLLSSSCNDYHDNTIIELMKMHLEGTNFTGLSVHLKYYSVMLFYACIMRSV